MRLSLLVLLALATPITGCGAAKTAGRRARLAVFKLQPKKAPFDRRLLDALHAHATRLLAESGLYQVVDRDELLRRLKRRRRRVERACYSLRCQSRLGPKLFDARLGLATQITEEVIGTCEVTARVFDLAPKRVARAAAAAGACEQADLVRSLDRALCHVIARRRAGAPAPLSIEAARPSTGCLAYAEFLWVDRQLETLAAVRARAEEREQRLAERVLELRRDYDRLAASRDPRTAVSAACRSGALYDRLADELVQGELRRVPYAVRRMGKRAVDAHRAQRQRALEQRAAPYRQKARQIYRRCLARAKKLGVDNRYTSEARAALSAPEG